MCGAKGIRLLDQLDEPTSWICKKKSFSFELERWSLKRLHKFESKFSNCILVLRQSFLPWSVCQFRLTFIRMVKILLKLKQSLKWKESSRVVRQQALGEVGALGAVVLKHVDQDQKKGLVYAGAFLKKYQNFRGVKIGTFF